MPPSQLQLRWCKKHESRPCLIRLAIANHEDYHFKFQSWSGNAKVIGGQRYFFFVKDHIDLLIVLTI